MHWSSPRAGHAQASGSSFPAPGCAPRWRTASGTGSRCAIAARSRALESGTARPGRAPLAASSSAFSALRASRETGRVLQRRLHLEVQFQAAVAVGQRRVEDRDDVSAVPSGRSSNTRDRDSAARHHLETRVSVVAPTSTRVPCLDVRKKRVLLRTVEAVDLVDEEQDQAAPDRRSFVAPCRRRA